MLKLILWRVRTAVILASLPVDCVSGTIKRLNKGINIKHPFKISSFSVNLFSKHFDVRKCIFRHIRQAGAKSACACVKHYKNIYFLKI